MMRAITSVLALTLVSVAFASGPASAGESWTGFYGGVNVGKSWSNFKVLDGPEGTSQVSCWWCTNDYGNSAGAMFGGGQVGYNYQIGHFVVGVEGDVKNHLLGGHASDPTHVTATGTANGSVDDDPFFAASGRLGYALGNMLIYGKAGWGAMDVKFNWADPNYSATASTSKLVGGAVFGGGAEYLINKSLSFKVEYERLNVRDRELLTTQVPPGFPFGGWHEPMEIKPVDTIEVGINVHLDK